MGYDQVMKRLPSISCFIFLVSWVGCHTHNVSWGEPLRKCKHYSLVYEDCGQKSVMDVTLTIYDNGFFWMRTQDSVNQRLFPFKVNSTFGINTKEIYFKSDDETIPERFLNLTSEDGYVIATYPFDSAQTVKISPDTYRMNIWYDDFISLDLFQRDLVTGALTFSLVNGFTSIETPEICLTLKTINGRELVDIKKSIFHFLDERYKFEQIE